MKMLKLRSLNVDAKDMLSREQMKNVRGGAYKCCWTGTNNCSSCPSGSESNWTCTSGATLTPC